MPQAAQRKRKYTYADYLTWSDNERWEIIRGDIYNMGPAPRPAHQSISMELGRQVANFLHGKDCQVFAAPFDVRFVPDAAEGVADTVVQPDISVICDSGKVDDRGCIGAPDLIIEILSEETGARDESTKLKLYEANGVREYWIVNPWDQTVRIYNINATGKYDFPRFITKLETAESNAIQGLNINLNEVFP